MVSNFCNAGVPSGICDTNCGIHFKHFNSKMQLFALIVRTNILPKPNQSKYFDFFDLKVMISILTNHINFSIGYVIMLNMINVRLVNYMPCGLVITSVFNVYLIVLPLSLATEGDFHITIEHIRSQVPLSMYEPQMFRPIVLPLVINEEDVY